MNEMMLEGALTLTTLEGEETALFTTRGKDHAMTIDDLQELGELCARAVCALHATLTERLLPAILFDIEVNATSILAPCDDLRVETVDGETLILIPVNHTMVETTRRMEEFEKWWFPHMATLDIRVIVDIDYRGEELE